MYVRVAQFQNTGCMRGSNCAPKAFQGEACELIGSSDHHMMNNRTSKKCKIQNTLGEQLTSSPMRHCMAPRAACTRPKSRHKKL